MNLRDHLSDILPDILPVESSAAVKGTQLIELVKERLQQTYSDATLRYHFSILSATRPRPSPRSIVVRATIAARREAASRGPARSFA